MIGVDAETDNSDSIHNQNEKCYAYTEYDKK